MVFTLDKNIMLGIIGDDYLWLIDHSNGEVVSSFTGCKRTLSVGTEGGHVVIDLLEMVLRNSHQL